MTKVGPTTTLESVVVSVWRATGGPVGAPQGSDAGPPLDLPVREEGAPREALECYQKSTDAVSQPAVLRIINIYPYGILV